MPAQGESHQEREGKCISLADAIQQLRDELRKVILEQGNQDIVFTPNGIDLELGVTFAAEAKVGGGFRLLTFLNLSADAKASRQNQHKIKISLLVADRTGQPIKLRDSVPKGLPR